MAAITFYKVDNLISFIFKFVSQLYEQQKKIIVVAEDKDFLKELDDSLWSLKQLSFIPHVMDTDMQIDFHNQPICLKQVPFENLNQADVVINVEGCADNIKNVAHIIECFKDERLFQKRQKVYKGQEVVCWVFKNGKWEKSSFSSEN